MGHTIRCYDYVNHPYAKVCDRLVADPVAVFQAATRAAGSHAESVAVALRVDIAGVEVTKNVKVEVEKVSEEPARARTPVQTRIALRWEASSSPRLFPLMNAVLSIYALTATETQLELQGDYSPPLGMLGGAIDALVGHRIAEASVQRFLSDTAAHLRRTLAAG